MPAVHDRMMVEQDVHYVRRCSEKSKAMVAQECIHGVRRSRGLDLRKINLSWCLYLPKVVSILLERTLVKN
jgi:hypothetical protein